MTEKEAEVTQRSPEEVVAKRDKISTAIDTINARLKQLGYDTYTMPDEERNEYLNLSSTFHNLVQQKLAMDWVLGERDTLWPDPEDAISRIRQSKDET